MSGHSKWSTIKRKKAITDAKRGKMFSKISRIISVAVREHGPKKETNFSLRLAIEKAKQINMPSETIDRIITKSSKNNARQMEEVLFEATGPNGSAFIISGITDSKNRTSQTIKHALSKHGAKLSIPGALSWMFEYKGEVTIPYTKETKEKVEMNAIESGAENIEEKDGVIIAITKPEDLRKVIAYLEEKNITIQNSELAYYPKQQVTISDEKTQIKIEKLQEVLQDNDDVQEVYDNIIFL